MAISRVGLDFLQAVALVEQRRAERDGHGQIVREHGRPEQAGIWRRISRVQGRRLAAFHQKSDALGQGSKQPLESGSILRQNVEAHDQRGGRLRRRHARLMEAIERLRILRAVIAGRERSGRRRPGLRAEPQADGAARQAHQEIAPSGLQPASSSRRLLMKPTRTDSLPDPGATSFGSLASDHSTPSVPFSAERSSASAVTGPLSALRSVVRQLLIALETRRPSSCIWREGRRPWRNSRADGR